MEVSEVLFFLSEERISTAFSVTIMLLVFALSILVSFAVGRDVFMQVGSSIQQSTDRAGEDFEIFLWLFHSNTIAKYYKDVIQVKLYSPYEGRVEFNKETHSLILKNLQKNDSGLYEAKTIGETNKVVAKYRLTVLDPVEVPVFHQKSTEDCNVTLTCRGHDLSIISSCYNEACDEKEVTSPSSVKLTLTTNGRVVNCNISNQVSWKATNIDITRLMQHCTTSHEQVHHLGSNNSLGHLGPAKESMLIVILTVLCITK